MTAERAWQIVRDVEASLPESSYDSMKYTLALLAQRETRRTLTAFELAVRDLILADLTGASVVTLSQMTLRAARALRNEMRGA